MSKSIDINKSVAIGFWTNNTKSMDVIYHNSDNNSRISEEINSSLDIKEATQSLMRDILRMALISASRDIYLFNIQLKEKIFHNLDKDLFVKQSIRNKDDVWNNEIFIKNEDSPGCISFGWDWLSSDSLAVDCWIKLPGNKEQIDDLFISLKNQLGIDSMDRGSNLDEYDYNYIRLGLIKVDSDKNMSVDLDKILSSSFKLFSAIDKNIVNKILSSPEK